MERRSGYLLALIATTCLLALHLAGLPLGAAEKGVGGVLTQHSAPVIVATPVGHSKSMVSAPLAILSRAEFAVPGKIEAMNRWNVEGRQPLKVGFVRPLEMSHLVSLSPDASSARTGVVEKTKDAVVWTSRIEVERAYRLRLRLTEVKLPAGTELWVVGDRGDATHFGLELLRQQGDLWTPSVGGSVIHLQVRIPDSSMQSGAMAPRFRVDSVAQIFRLDADGAAVLDPILTLKGTECLLDAACVGDSELPGIDSYKEAVAHLQFMVGNDALICSGALMNDTDDSGFIPYMLTANHCFSTQSSASTLEAFFDYIASSCGGPVPNLGSLPRVTGATLLATTPNTDSTFARLSRNPSGSTFYVGWTTATSGSGIALGRLSHPMGWSQTFSATQTFDPGGGTCEGWPANRHIYSDPLLGGTAGGSSGAPTVDLNVQVRGQLRGACGPDPGDPCNVNNAEVDGRFANFFSTIAEYLDPTPQTGCQPSDTVLCLNDNRFKVEVDWDTGSTTGDGQVVPGGTGDSSNLWFFSANNWEMLFKVLDGCSINNHFWVFFAATTDVGFTVTVTDTQTNDMKQYSNPLGQAADAVTDTSAFATCP